MEAFGFYRPGDPTVFEQVDIVAPTPAPDELLIHTEALGLNNRERMMRQNAPAGPLTVLGFDVAGTIAAVGAHVTGFTIGQRVLSHTIHGDADLVVATADDTASLPDNVSYVEAAALVTPGITAYRTVSTFAHLQSGQTVIVKGAAGGVGHLVVQLARQAGADVIGIAAAAHRDQVLQAGALRFVAYDQTDLAVSLANAGDIVINVALDGVGGAQDAAMVKPGGQLVSVSHQQPQLDKGATFTHIRPASHPTDAATLQALVTLVAAGKLHQVIDTVLPFTLAGIQEGHRRLDEPHNGRIVLSRTI